MTGGGAAGRDGRVTRDGVLGFGGWLVAACVGDDLGTTTRTKAPPSNACGLAARISSTPAFVGFTCSVIADWPAGMVTCDVPLASGGMTVSATTNALGAAAGRLCASCRPIVTLSAVPTGTDTRSGCTTSRSEPFDSAMLRALTSRHASSVATAHHRPHHVPM